MIFFFFFLYLGICTTRKPTFHLKNEHFVHRIEAQKNYIILTKELQEEYTLSKFVFELVLVNLPFLYFFQVSYSL
ncbi:hypothetical protein BD770DRAFT_384408, partial [Pilaira anomala]